MVLLFFSFPYTLLTNPALWPVESWRETELCNTGMEGQGGAWPSWASPEPQETLRLPLTRDGRAEEGVRGRRPAQPPEACQKEHLSEAFKTMAVGNV